MHVAASCLQSKQRANTLTEQVVDPSNTTRIRLLPGRIPEKEELVAKLQVRNTSPYDALAAELHTDWFGSTGRICELSRCTCTRHTVWATAHMALTFVCVRL
jgi:hypothetical protein